jgi:RNA polymerase sigma factor (sigma-70 family)
MDLFFQIMFLLCLCILFATYESLYLSHENYRLVVKLIKSPITCVQRKAINKIIYNSYENWAVSRAIAFKKTHSYKCRDIHLNELIVSSKYGLYKSILKYNGCISFTQFANIYLLSELYKVITDQYSLSSMPKSLRKQGKKDFSRNDIVQYKKKLFVSVQSWQDKTYSEKIDKLYYNDSLNVFWEMVNQLDPFMKRIFHLKYNYDFTKIRSNKAISELLCCSEENVRKTLTKGISSCTIESLSRGYITRNV